MAQTLLKKLETFMAVNVEERRALLDIPTRTAEIKARSAFGDEAEERSAIHVVEEGFACRFKKLPDGRRQILGFLVPGDISDLRVFVFGEPASAHGALSNMTVSLVEPDHILDVAERFPRLMRGLWWATLVEESVTREWLVNVGQRSALERMSHLLCELHARLSAVGRVEDDAFHMPVTQTELADTLGLSSVHVNRTLQELRRRGLIRFQDGRMELKDIEALQSLAMFSPDYLRLRPRRAGARAG